MVALQEEISCANLCKTDSGLTFHESLTVVSIGSNWNQVLAVLKCL